MGIVIDLEQFRRKERKRYLDRIEVRLAGFLESFVAHYVHFDLIDLTKKYQEERIRQKELAWDYQAFRELLQSAFEESVAKVLMEQISLQPWFDAKHISADEVLDRCLSTYLLSQSYAQAMDDR